MLAWRSPRAREGYRIPDNQHTSQGILSNLGVHQLEVEVDIWGLLILDPFVQVARGEDNVVQHPSDLRELGLEPRLVQIAGAGLEDLFLMVLDALLQSVCVGT